MITRALCLLFVLPAVASAQSTGEPPFSAVSGAFFAVSVPDLDASIRWYSERLGLKVMSRFPEQNQVAGALLAGGGLEVELLRHEQAVLPKDAAEMSSKVRVLGIMKAGFRVDNFDRTVAALRVRGVEIVMGPYPARRDQRANVLIRDNTGNLIQIFGDFAP
jgi:catechol 2,3-dioxygenase-like lactoylglutathione lyase family enzyme